MTDLHTHILPDMDDGSRNVTTTNLLIEDEIKNGVSQIALTPHFDFTCESVSSFLARRETSFSLIDVSLFPSVTFKLGAEVHFCEELLEFDASELLSLCLQDTKYMLLELSMFEAPDMDKVRTFIKHLTLIGVIPIIAHVERYNHYLKVDGIKELIDLGCLIQCNCESLLRDKREIAYIKSLISKGLVHVFATDTHSVARRPVNMARALSVLDDASTFVSNADEIFWDKKIRT